ncbi:MAG TPA: MBL fold metallo-hydrolase [Acetobacteraceae bacterium]|nr:MBL fold metallo-hydrolase [Acetobacteraceae bacterium]
MKVTLLGTGGSAGVPQIGGRDGRGDWGACDPTEPRNVRTRASIVIDGEGGTLLVDTTPDMRGQLIACAVRQVDAILFTHAHADHIAGLDDIRILNRIVERPLDAFATQATIDQLVTRFDYAFKPWQPPGFFRPVIVPRAVFPGDTIEAAGLRIALFDQDHGFTRSLGLRVDWFGYSTDVVDLDDAAFAALDGIDTWVVDCFQRAPHRTHAWLSRVIGWVERLKPRRSVLTHMGGDMDFAALVKRLPSGIEPGFDGQVLELSL